MDNAKKDCWHSFQFSGRKKQELGQEIGIDGWLIPHVFGGRFGRKGMLDVLGIGVEYT